MAFYQNAIGRMKQNLRENAKFRVSGLFFGESNSHVHEKKAFTFMISVSNLWFYGADRSFATNCIYAKKNLLMSAFEIEIQTFLNCRKSVLPTV